MPGGALPQSNPPPPPPSQAPEEHTLKTTAPPTQLAASTAVWREPLSHGSSRTQEQHVLSGPTPDRCPGKRGQLPHPRPPSLCLWSGEGRRGEGRAEPELQQPLPGAACRVYPPSPPAAASWPFGRRPTGKCLVSCRDNPPLDSAAPFILKAGRCKIRAGRACISHLGHRP